VPDLDTLLGHPLCGRSFEGFAIEQIVAHLPGSWSASYYRTSAQAEIDLVLEGAGQRRLAIEIKRSLSPQVPKGFINGCEDIEATERYLVVPEGESYARRPETRVVPLPQLIRELAAT
jgi:predicted AAA+ superfamily ATPase